MRTYNCFSGLVSRVVVLLVVALGAGALAAQEPVPLPVRKVVLYKNGMGYFEHLGRIRGAQSVEITLPSSQLNDVLKSLTVLDLGGGQVVGVTYDSVAPLDRRLRELPIDLNKAQSLVGFLNQIRGAAVEVRAPSGLVTGRLMGAELRSRTTGPGASTQVTELSIFTDAGEVRVVELESAGGLRLTESSLASDVGRYLDLLDSAHRRDLRRLKIQTSGRGQRQLFVSYTAEAPIWKTTYRIVLGPKKKPLLQGWAIVDNTTPLDWTNVELSLVAGAPISFIQNLSQPIYGRRPVVPLPEGVQVTPQTHEGTIGALEKERVVGGVVGGVPAAKEARADVMALRMLRAEKAVPPPTASLELGEAIRQQQAAGARGQALGEQFEYKLRQPVTIGKNQSALLPILQAEVEGEKVSLFNPSYGETRPRLAIWLKNTSGATLDAGSFTVIDSNAFAGEGLTTTIQPGESRLLSYALDLGVEITTNRGSEQKRVERVVIHRGLMRLHRKLVETRTYTIRNNAGQKRTVVLEHPLRNGWKLVATPEPAESSANYYRFQVQVAAKQTTEFSVREERPQETMYRITNITPEQIVMWVRARSINPEIERALQGILAKKNEINNLTKQIEAFEREQTEIFRDQERVRKNLQRLGRTPEEANLRQRYIRQLEQQENRLGAMRAERNRQEEARDAAQRALDTMIEDLNFDKSL